MSETATQLIATARNAGIMLWVERGALKFRAPAGTLTGELREAIRTNRDAVIAALQAGTTLTEDPTNQYEPFALTDIQAAYLLGRSSTYQTGGVACHAYLEVDMGPIDRVRLERALELLIARHGALRTSFHTAGFQQVHPVSEITRPPVVEVDATGLPALIAEFSHEVLDAENPPLLRLGISRGATASDDRLHVSVDFLMADWTGITLLIDQLVALHANPETDLGEPGPTFRDYVMATSLDESDHRVQADRRFWSERLGAAPEPPELPLVPSRADAPATFTRYAHALSPEATIAFLDRARAAGVSPAALAMSGYAKVLGTWSQNREFALVATLLDRQDVHPRIGSLIGDFTSTGLVPVKISDTDDLTRQISSGLADVLDHRTQSGVAVMRDLNRRTGGVQRFFPYVFTAAIDPSRITEKTSQAWRITGGITQTPQVFIDCQVSVLNSRLCVNWDVRDGTIDADVIATMFGCFTNWLDGAADAIDVSEKQLAARQRVPATTEWPNDCLHTAFFTTASTFPQRVAIIDGDGEHSFSELAHRALDIAAWLSGQGISTGDRVVICLPREAGQVAAVLGVVAAGGCYVPVDVSHPRARRERVIASCGARVVLDADVLETIPQAGDPAQVRVANDPDADAYVIFTSGSTGDPKGVVMTHRAALNTIVDVRNRWNVGDEDRGLMVSSLGFDLSVFDIFGVLAFGGSLVIPAPSNYTDPSVWADLVSTHGVTLWNSAPAQASMVCDAAAPGALAGLRLVLVSGDWVPVNLGSRLWEHNPSMTVVALGGATEAGIWSNFHVVAPGDENRSSVPYGVALSGQAMDVVDADGRSRPDLVAGDIVIAGGSLARCYENDPESTTARFVERAGTRWYLTGDRGRWLPEGEIEFLGRLDTQVKVRGHRIELGEIESTALGCEGVAQAVAVAHSPDPQIPRDRQIALFVTPTDNGECSELATYLDSALAVAERTAAKQGTPGTTAHDARLVAALTHRLAAWLSRHERHTLNIVEFASGEPVAPTVIPVIHGFDFQYHLFSDDTAHQVVGDMRLISHGWAPGAEIAAHDSSNMVIVGAGIPPEVVAAELNHLASNAWVVVLGGDDKALANAGACVVVPLGGGSTGHVAVFDTLDAEELVKQVRQVLAEQLPPGWIPATVAVRSELPLTPNGKVDRAGLVELANGTASEVAVVADEDSLCLEICRVVLHRPELAAGDNLFAHGADSMVMAQLVTAVRKQLPQAARFSFDVILRALMDDPRPAGLDSFLQDSGTGIDSPASPAVTLPVDVEHGVRLLPQAEGEGTLLRVLAPGALGSSGYLEALATKLRIAGQVVGVELTDPAWYLSLPQETAFSELAQTVAPLVADLSPSRVQVIGHSIGGFLAGHISGALGDLGVETLAPVIINATPLTMVGSDELLREIFFLSVVGMPITNLGLELSDLMSLGAVMTAASASGQLDIPATLATIGPSDPALGATAERLLGFYAMSDAERLTSYARNQRRNTGEEVDEELFHAQHDLFSHNYAASEAPPPTLLTDIHLVVSDQDNSYIPGVAEQRVSYWRQATIGELHEHAVPGDHFSCVTPPLVSKLADTILRLSKENA